MPIHKIEAGVDFVRLWPSSNLSHERTEIQVRALLPARDRNNKAKIAERMTAELQRSLETRKRLADLVAVGDPAGLADPGRPDFFWDLATQELVARPVQVTITWDGTVFVPELRRLG